MFDLGNDRYPMIGICPRCSKRFVKYSENDIFCSEPCEFELPRRKDKKIKKKAVFGIDTIVGMIEDNYKKTGRLLSYGEFVSKNKERFK